MKIRVLNKVVIIYILTAIYGCQNKSPVPVISTVEQQYIIKTATAYLDSFPVTVTAAICERSAGNSHDFYSEGDYWWPDPENRDGPYIQKDGQTNPENFVAHRLAMIRLSQIVAMQTSAYLLTGDKKFIEATQKHLEAWFVNPETRMNPSLLYVQAIKGKVTGRGIGIIDAIHLIEVARSVEILEKNGVLPYETSSKVKDWFSEFVTWLTTHQYGIDEMNAKNNHGTCWVMQVGMFARLVGDKQVLELCRERFKNVLLPNQMAPDGSFPLELKRTKPYGYSLFNLDAFMVTAEILSDKDNNLYAYSSSDGLNLQLGAEFLFQFVKDKSTWTYPPDVMYFEEWPVRQPFLLFAGLAYNKPEYIELWKSLEGYPKTPEVIRNLPIRNPLIWLMDEPVKMNLTG
ncbi:MAG: alginate lyase family protein [Draconibacterium sp.]|nr:alginate lyase family protein [Draconibacterium sp.]